MNVANTSFILKIQNNIEKTNNQTVNHTEKLAAGIRITQASDDASGVKISEKMRAQIRGLEMSLDNATDGISMLQTAEGGLNAIGELLQRMNELAIKSINGIHTTEDMRKISNEYEQCKSEIDRIAETTTFNGRHLLNVTVGETKVEKGTQKIGTLRIPANAKDEIDFSTLGDGNEFTVKIDDEEHKFIFSYGNKGAIPGATVINLNGDETNYEKAKKLEEAIEDNISGVKAEVYLNYPDDGKKYTIAVSSLDKIEGQKIELTMETNAPLIKIGNKHDDVLYLELYAVRANDLEVKNTDILTIGGANKATRKITEAIEKITEYRGRIGTLQNQLQYSIKRIMAEQENTAASESRIRNLDMAEEMVRFAKNRIIQETGISMLAQANQNNGVVLKLIK